MSVCGVFPGTFTKSMKARPLPVREAASCPRNSSVGAWSVRRGPCRGALGAVVAAFLGGCTATDHTLAGLPTDFAGAALTGTSPKPPNLTFAFDGYYVGTLASEPGSLVAEGATATGTTALAPRPIPRDMLVVDGRATFGTNLPFTGFVAQDGGVEMRYGDFGTLAGRFVGEDFSGVLIAGAASEFRWPVRLRRVPSPAAVESVQPEPVDLQPGIGEPANAPPPPAIPGYKGVTGLLPGIPAS